MTRTDSGTSRLRTVVFADGALAQPTVLALLEGGWLAGLCTSRQSSSGAGLRHLARLAGIPILEVSRDSLGGGADSAVGWLRALRPDVLLSFAFPYRVPSEVLSIPRLGGFNVHGGKLPEYRGPQPVFWEIVNREIEGAATVHCMDEQFDHGPIVASQRVPIGPDDTHGLHLVRLSFAAVQVVEALFHALVQYGGDLPAIPQDERRAGFHRRPSFEDLVIRWEDQPAERIRGIVKAGNPWNGGAFASIRGINLRITDVTLREGGGTTSAQPGTILTTDADHGVVVNCRDGAALRLDVVSMEEGILPGGMLATFGIQAGERFGAPVRQDSLPAAAAG